MQILQRVLAEYGFKGDDVKTEVIGSGLINHTWKVTEKGSEYILQRVNQDVFQQPDDIAYNIDLIAAYLKAHSPSYRFISPVTALDGRTLVYLNGEGYFRVFPFVKESVSIDTVETTKQAYEGAAQFGRFTRLLSGFNSGQLRITIPSFHDLTLRYQQFLSAIETGNQQRVKESVQLIKQLLDYSAIAAKYQRIKSDPSFKLRVTHHDAKISNVLFDEHGNGLCVIDLDTVMPGYFFSDAGDMMRTYLSPVNEEETDFSKIDVRADFYKAIAEGYFTEMKDELTDAEKRSFFYAGEFMIYMQAIRFLTDHLNDDRYYGAKYPAHNYNRAYNQAVLLEKYNEAKAEMEQITQSLLL